MKFNLKFASIKKFKPSKLLRFLPKLTLLILLVGFGGSIYFLYKYFYQTIAQVRVVSILRNQVALNQVNVPLYQKVLTALDLKKQFDDSVLNNMKDPFQPLTVPTIITDAPTIEEVNTAQ